MTNLSDGLQCPVPDSAHGDRIALAHGEGGRLMRRLLAEEIMPSLDNAALAQLGDAAHLPQPSGRVAMSTDSFVVSPLFFPGGDIGKLAIYGTANDLAVSGARPRWLTLSMILEEGLPLGTLRRVIGSIAEAARQVGVTLVAGDTKVVPRGVADQMFLNTAGVGELVDPVPPGPEALKPGDQILVSGPIGRHGVAVIAAREQLGFQPPPESDCASLVDAVEALRTAGVAVRAVRDATRGGLSAVMHEWAGSSGHSLALDENLLPVTDDVRGACELLGLDPVYVANEGTMVISVPEDAVDAALTALRSVDVSSQAAHVGSVCKRRIAPVIMRRGARELPLDEPLGAPLPRIC